MLSATVSIAGERITLREITATLDSPEVRRLISDAATRQAELDHFWLEHTKEEGIRFIREIDKHPDDYPPGHGKFLSEMDKAPKIDIPNHTRAEVVEFSNAHCQKSVVYTTTYLRFKILSGPFKGREVWICGHLPVD